MDPGARNLILVFVAVWGGIFSFYGFLGYRARLWSPLWAIEPTTRHVARAPATPVDIPFARGRRLYRELRCGVCHGPEGEGGVKNPNADPDGLVPNLYDLADGFTRQDLKDRLRKGSQTKKLEEDKPQAPLDMPAWRDLLSDGDVEALAEYLFSLKAPAGATEEAAPESEEAGSERGDGT
ncbi:MAG: cytochrome c [Elusimicrobia bacterium]|nr:cytochrome c [Elusimicrobiota bacterium]